MMLLEKTKSWKVDVVSLIRDEHFSAEKAIHHAIERCPSMMAELDKRYLRERATDFREGIGTRLVKNALGMEIVI